MARHVKKGLDYFPMDTDFVRDLKIQRLLLEFGSEGLSVFMAVLCEVYASQGYYVAVRSGFYTDIGFTLGMDAEKVKQIAEYCLKLGLLDHALYKQWGILTSYGVQQRYSVIRRNEENSIKPKYLITREECFSDTENLALARINQQRKVKKKKVKKKKAKKMKTKEVEKLFMKKINPENPIPTTPGAKNSFAWQRLQQEIAAMRKLYGEAADFLALFTPELQPVAAREWIRAYTGTAPSLTAVARGYNEETAIVWLCIQVEDINLFAGVREKMPIARQKELARLILTEYSHLKVSEFQLFCYRLKCGRSGRFYGSVDALFISSALLLFMAERRQDRAQIEDMLEKQRKNAPPSPNAITYTEYLERKKQREGGNNDGSEKPEGLRS
jgi:hypothetical protein